MDLGPLRELTNARNFAVHGIPVTVILAWADPVLTRGIWLTPLTEQTPLTAEFQRRAPRPVMALPKSDVETIPRGTLIVAPEKSGDPEKTWRVDGLESEEGEHFRVILVEDEAKF